MKRQPTEWKNILAKGISPKELMSKIDKELIQLNIEKTDNTVKEKKKKRPGDLNRHFSKDTEGQQTGKYAQHHSSSGKCKSKPQ